MAQKSLNRRRGNKNTSAARDFASHLSYRRPHYTSPNQVMSKKGKMVFVASHSRTPGAHYANSDRLQHNEVLSPSVQKNLLPVEISPRFLPSEFFSSANWQDAENSAGAPQSWRSMKLLAK